jgi:hypothetical protein
MYVRLSIEDKVLQVAAFQAVLEMSHVLRDSSQIPCFHIKLTA